MKIKIIKNDNLGDLVLAIPFIYCLETLFPSSEIQVFVKNSEFVQLRKIFKLKSRFKVFPDRRRLFQLMHEFHAAPCILIDLVGNRFNSLFCNMNLNFSSGVNRYNVNSVYGHEFKIIDGMHESLNFLMLLKKLLKTLRNRAVNQITEELKHIEKVKPGHLDIMDFRNIYRPFFRTDCSTEHILYAMKYFVFHAGGHIHKRFSDNDQKILIARLSRLRMTAVIAGHSGERESGRFIESEFLRNGCKVVNLCGDTDTLEKLADVIRQAEFFIGPDSGPAHLSGAVGCRTIVYFAPTSSDRFAPLGRDTHVFKSSCVCTSCWQPQSPLKCQTKHCLDSMYFQDLLKFIGN